MREPAFRILIMGIPGSGKTYLAVELKQQLESAIIHNRAATVEWFNADIIRKQFNDWDFSVEGRIRQSVRMKELSDSSLCDFVICDFVAPLPVMRDNFDANFTVWVDTIDHSIYADTDKLFVNPLVIDYHVTDKSATKWAALISAHLIP